MNNLILIGMPGCGKSTAGVVLAKTLGMDFVDVDLEIIRRTGKKLQQILDEDGVEAFLEVEADVVVTLTCHNTVIATGGSAVLRERAVKKLKKLGKLVYLSLPYEEVAQRIPNLDDRGIAFQPGQSLKDAYDKRTPIYQALADVTVDISGLTLAETVEKLTREVADYI